MVPPLLHKCYNAVLRLFRYNSSFGVRGPGEHRNRSHCK